MNYARALKICRASFEIEQQELAEKMGVTPSYLSLIESGKRSLSKSRVEQVSQIFGISPELLRLLASDPKDLKDSKKLSDVTKLSHLLLELLSAQRPSGSSR